MAKSDAVEENTAVNSDTTFTVSVLRCKKTGKVLYLEAEKDFVDTLISFLLLPVGAVHRMSSIVQTKPLGSISTMSESLAFMDPWFVHVDKRYLLEPRPAAVGICEDAGLLKGSGAAKSSIFLHPLIMEFIPKKVYNCNSSHCTSISMSLGTPCEPCRVTRPSSHTIELNMLDADLESLDLRAKKVLRDPYEESKESPTGYGFAREKFRYMVTDCLEIMPSNSVTVLKVLNQLRVATLADLESKDVIIDITQVLQILRTALTSSTCLTDVFRKK